MIAPLAVCLRDGTILNAVTYSAGDLLYGVRQDPHEPFGPMFADIPSDAGLVGPMERDRAYYPQPESGYEYHYLQGGRRYKFAGRDDVSVVSVFVQDELEDPAPLPGVEAIASSAFAGTMRWRKRTDIGGIPSRPVEGEYDFLRGQPTIDQKATNKRDNAILDAQNDADRAEVRRLAQERQKAMEQAVHDIQASTRESLPDLIASFIEKASADPAYSRLATLAQQVLADLLAEPDS